CATEPMMLADSQTCQIHREARRWEIKQHSSPCTRPPTWKYQRKQVRKSPDGYLWGTICWRTRALHRWFPPPNEIPAPVFPDTSSKATASLSLSKGNRTAAAERQITCWR